MSTYRHGTNYYEILEVERDAPQNEIHKAYQRAKTTYSADNPALYSMFSKEEARELLQMIEEAYSVLGNQTQRRQYDQSLLAGDPNSPDNMSSNPSAKAEALNHEQLPDFNMPESGSTVVEDFTVRIRETPRAASPAGMGRTTLSMYKLDEAIEKEIAAIEEWDGQSLQRVRLYKNVSIDQLSEATRVSRAYLMALEANEYGLLPAPVFVRGFVVQVARLLNLNDGVVASSYMKLLKAKSDK